MKDARTPVEDRAQLPCTVIPSSPCSTAPVSLTLFPAAVRPEQFFSLTHHHGKGEAALAYAVLEDAFNCFIKQFMEPSPRARRLAEEAEEWFVSEDERWPFSFINVCCVLGINPEYVRKGLKQWRQRRPARVRRIRQQVVRQSLYRGTAA
jgi:hypothetical protein